MCQSFIDPCYEAWRSTTVRLHNEIVDIVVGGIGLVNDQCLRAWCTRVSLQWWHFAGHRLCIGIYICVLLSNCSYQWAFILKKSAL